MELIYALWRRDIVKFLRDKQQLVTSVLRPLFWMVGMGFGFRRYVAVGSEGHDYMSFLVPGILMMAVLFTSMFAAISVLWDRDFGFLKELLVAPVPRLSLVVAKMASASTMALIDATVLLLISPLFGARVSPLGSVLALVLCGIWGMAVNGFGLVLATSLKSFEGFGGMVNFFVQPVFFLSGALYPIDHLPLAFKVATMLNPMTYVVDAVRGLMVGEHHFSYLLDLSVMSVTTAAALVLGARSFARLES